MLSGISVLVMDGLVWDVALRHVSRRYWSGFLMDMW